MAGIGRTLCRAALDHHGWRIGYPDSRRSSRAQIWERDRPGRVVKVPCIRNDAGKEDQLLPTTVWWTELRGWAEVGCAIDQLDGGQMDETATVLVTVKTYPSPSDRYGETVCVAGVRLDRGVPEWVRLYPMKFRLVDYEQQFKKYEIIEIPLTPRGTEDPRPESMRPDQTRMRSVRQVDTTKNWAGATHADPAADRSDDYVRSDRGQQGRGLFPASTFPRFGQGARCLS